MTHLVLFALVAVADPVGADAASRLAARIDARLAVGADAAAPASDAEFLRRVTLDLHGRIPTVAEARTFLDDRADDKRTALVERLLAASGYTAHAARQWRDVLAPQATANPRTQHLGLSVEAWVGDRLRAGATDAFLVRDLLTARLDYLDWTPAKAAAPAAGLSPVGFYQANDLKPETVAAAVGRTFLGLKLECAQCHDHPFDKWTQRQSWETAAFFAGVAPLEPVVVPAADLADRRELTIPDTKTTVVARLLDGTAVDAGTGPRQAFAAWLTKPGNPYFARVMANRVWVNLFGVGLVEPADDWGPHNPPSHPELLDDLAAAYTAGGFDPKVLVRAITATAAYRRTSRQSHESQADPLRFARMPVKGLSAEQLFDSLALATGYRDPVTPSARAVVGWEAKSPRGQYIARFGGGANRTDMQVSVLQALSLMNGGWTGRQTDPARGEMARAVAEAPFLTGDQKIETLFLATLSRRPTGDELARHAAHVAAADAPAKGLADVLWVLVNSHEFLVNH